MTTALRRGRRGFTLVELLVTLVILGILASIAFTGLKSIRARAELAATRTDVQAVGRTVWGLLQSYTNTGTRPTLAFSTPAAGTSTITFTPGTGSNPSAASTESVPVDSTALLLFGGVSSGASPQTQTGNWCVRLYARGFDAVYTESGLQDTSVTQCSRVTGQASTRANLLEITSSFESNMNNWSTWGTGAVTRTWSNARGWDGTGSVLITGNTTTGGGYHGLTNALAGYSAPVRPGATYTASTYVYRVSGSSAIVLRGEFYTAGGTYLGSTSASVQGLATTPVSSWTRLTSTGTAPAGAAQMRISVGYMGVATTDEMHLDGLMIEEGAAGSYLDSGL